MSIRVVKHWRNGTLLNALARKAQMPFQRRPYPRPRPYASYTQSHLHKGPGYHAGFDRVPGRRMIWEMEQEVLEQFAREHGPFASHLDFAGGTGRIAHILHKHCNAQRILDVSGEMLAVAREMLPDATFIQRDFNAGVPEIPEASQDLVTAFRFFPNAEAELRSGGMRFVASRLKPGGYLICNNHRNFWSLPWITWRVTLRGGTSGMTNDEMIGLARENGLRLLRRYSMGVVPQTEEKAILPWRAVERLERYIFRHAGGRHGLGYNVVFVFIKAAE